MVLNNPHLWVSSTPTLPSLHALISHKFGNPICIRSKYVIKNFVPLHFDWQSERLHKVLELWVLYLKWNLRNICPWSSRNRLRCSVGEDYGLDWFRKRYSLPPKQTNTNTIQKSKNLMVISKSKKYILKCINILWITHFF